MMTTPGMASSNHPKEDQTSTCSNPKNILPKWSTAPRSPSPTQHSLIPGYAGYVSKTGPENVFGVSFGAAIKVREDGSNRNTSAVLSKPTSPSRAPVYIPGYAGHVPNTVPDNIFGVPHQLANELALDGGMVPRWDAPAPDTHTAHDKKPIAASRLDAKIPGYAGHVRGKGPEEVFGMTFHKANQAAVQEVDANIGSGRKSPTRKQNEKRKGAEIPGYAGHVPRKDADNIFGLSFCVANRFAEDALTEDGHVASCKPPHLDSRDLSPVRNGCQVPGYAGHIPKKGPQNVFGATFHAANQQAGTSRDRDSDKNVCNQAAACRAIPGYSGFTPGKFAENVCGKTFKSANHQGFAEFDSIRRTGNTAGLSTQHSSACTKVARQPRHGKSQRHRQASPTA